jgi:S-adenosylmethionine synthetase
VAHDYLFTSESVSDGHPDKVCDQISDAIVDLYLAAEPEARVAVETLATTNRVVLAGEVRGPGSITRDDLVETARRVIQQIGYNQPGFSWRDAVIECHVHAQSADIAAGVDADVSQAKDEGAGDQGLMFGYACNETPSLMPAPIDYAHRILRALSEARRSGAAPGLGPDAKSQVTLAYEGKVPTRTGAILVSTQHDDNVSQADVRDRVRAVVEAVMPSGWMCADDKFYTNPTGRFVVGGPDGDCGLTGRKIIVDTYGGAAPHGGGAFSGKDPTKVDRSAAYAMRYLAKNVVAAGLSSRCTLQVAYGIGMSEPISLHVDLHGDGQVDPVKLAVVLREHMSLSPRGIRTHLSLNRPIYQRSAAFGHFGRMPEEDGGFSWEKTDLAASLKAAFA